MKVAALCAEISQDSLLCLLELYILETRRADINYTSSTGNESSAYDIGTRIHVLAQSRLSICQACRFII